MTRPIRFHVLLLPNVSWDELRARAIWIEELGFETIALADHFVDWTRPTEPWLETWTLLGSLAEATSSVRLSTAVTQMPLRNPAMLARQVLTLDHLSHGRAELGLGTGLMIDPSSAMAGLPNWGAGERVDRFAEYLEMVMLLLKQDVTTYHGQFYSAEDAATHRGYVPERCPPVMVAALGPRMMRIAARHANSWNSLSFATDFDAQLAETRVRGDAMDRYLDEIGRDPASLERSYLMFDPTSRYQGGEISYYQSLDRFRDMAGRVIELGITDLGVYYPIVPEQLPIFEEIARVVLPELRG